MAHKRNRGPTFRGAIVVLWLATVVFAVYGATGWLVSMWSVSPPLAVMLAVAFGTAPLIAAAMTEPAIRGGGLAAWAAVLVFCGMDAAGNVHAFWSFEKVAMAEENTARTESYSRALATYTAAHTAATELQAAASASLLALPSATAACEGLGPKNCEARLAGLAADRKALTEQRDEAKQTLAALVPPVKPEEARMLPMEATAAIHVLLSFALVSGFLGVHNARRKAQPVEAKAKPKRKPAAKAKPEPVKVPGPHPRLVTKDGQPLQGELFH